MRRILGERMIGGGIGEFVCGDLWSHSPKRMASLGLTRLACGRQAVGHSDAVSMSKDDGTEKRGGGDGDGDVR